MEVKRTIKTDVESFELGDVISFKLKDGEKVQAKAVKQTDEGVLFITVDCLKDNYPMFKNPGWLLATESWEINYFNSDLRHALNGEILDRFPDEIRSRMVGMRIGATDAFDLLRIPTERELFGENRYGKEKEPDTVEQFKGMKNRRNRIAFQGSKTGTWEWYWLQNRVEDTASDFAFVGNGGAYYYGASSSGGVRPIFLLSCIA